MDRNQTSSNCHYIAAWMFACKASEDHTFGLHANFYDHIDEKHMIVDNIALCLAEKHSRVFLTEYINKLCSCSILAKFFGTCGIQSFDGNFTFYIITRVTVYVRGIVCDKENINRKITEKRLNTKAPQIAATPLPQYVQNFDH